MAVQVFMPKMSDNMEAGEILGWLVKEGERVERGQPILELMTDKVTAELEAPASGILRGIREGAVEGAIIPVGITIAYIGEPDEALPVLPPLIPADARPAAPVAASVAAEPAAPPEPPAGPPQSTPAARRVAKELGIDIARVRPGPENRIREEDVRAYAATLAAGQAGPVSPSSSSVGPDGEWVELNRVQQITGRRMLESVQTAPQFALSATVDVTDLLARRAAIAEAERPSITAILVQIVAQALRRLPRANASYQDGRLKLHPQVNIGVAIGSDEGLVVPVIKDAGRKPLAEIARQLQAFRAQAARRLLSAEDMQGGTFTISNLGMFAVDQFTAIINPPESAILAVGRIAPMPKVMPDGSLAPRSLVSLTLTIDHRTMDGLIGARLLTDLKEQLEQADLQASPAELTT